MFAGSGSHESRIWADLDFLPGEHDLTLLLPSKPGKCWVDGVLTEFDYETRAANRPPSYHDAAAAL